MTMEDWLPTLMTAVGQPDVKEKLLGEYTAGDNAYQRIHLDGYDQTDLLMGKGPSARKEFYYFTETKLHGVRYGDWKFLFVKQDKWFNGVQQNMLTPLLTNSNSTRSSASRKRAGMMNGRKTGLGPIIPPSIRSACSSSR